MRYKHIIWDWNGTLFNDVRLCIDIINELLKKNDIATIELDKYKDVFTFPVSKYYEAIGFNKEDFGYLSIEFINEYERRKLECPIFKGAKELLKSNKESGISQYILSAYKDNTLLEIIEHFELGEFFTKISGHSDIYATCKIDRGREQIKSIESEKSEILLIGDTYHDYEVASDIGIDSILLSHGHNSEKILCTTGRPIVRDFEELYSMLNSL